MVCTATDFSRCTALQNASLKYSGLVTFHIYPEYATQQHTSNNLTRIYRSILAYSNLESFLEASINIRIGRHYRTAVQHFAVADQPNRGDFPGSGAIEWFVPFRASAAFRLAAKLHRWVYLLPLLTKAKIVITMYVHSGTRCIIMATIIKTRLIKIGNSQGLRIPKLILEQLNLSDDIELEVQDHQLIVRPTSHPRASWAEQFERMAINGDNHLLDTEPVPTEWEETEWQW
jgi:antitoxin MazE